MAYVPRLPHIFALSSSLLFSFACGSPASIGEDPGGQSGGTGGTGVSTNPCEALFGNACDRPCSSEEPCPEGMSCRGGHCHAECGEGFPCAGSDVCSPSGICSPGITPEPPEECEPQTCEEVNFACGAMVDRCGNVVQCADEGLSCTANEVCVGNPTECVLASFLGECDVCSGIPDCSGESQVTRLEGRVVSPGRSDDDAPNQVGIPNAVVYILRSAQISDLPSMSTGIEPDGTSCDRCDEQDYGPVLVGTVTDATGQFALEEYIPVDTDLLLVVKAGKFRRAVEFKLPASAACETTALPQAIEDGNPTRLPRHMDDGLAVNIPHVAVSTGTLDAMECVFYKMGIAEGEFSDPNDGGRIHLYRSNGAWPPGTPEECAACAGCGTGGGTTASNCRATHCNSGATCNNACRDAFIASCQSTFDASLLTEDDGTITNYDLSVFDCEGGGWDSTIQRPSHNVREYVNRGGRMFASHLSFTWLHESADDNGAQLYSSEDPLGTGLGPASTWEDSSGAGTLWSTGNGQISLPSVVEPWQWDAPASPRIEDFVIWMDREGIAHDPEYSFSIIEPRSRTTGPGEHSEVFVHVMNNDERVQQFSFNTPYGAPEEAVCGRVAYSGFHVSVGDTPDVVFPSHCGGNLTDQEKVLLYMLFDLGACVGSEPPPEPCVPATCPSNACGFMPDGCGEVVDCGVCVPRPVH